MIPAYYVYSENVVELVHRFEKHLENQEYFDLRKRIIKLEGIQTADYQSEGWKNALVMKLEVSLGWIEENLGSIILLTDIDVQIFQPKALHDYVLTRMEDEELDILGMREFTYDDMNGGVIFLRASKATLELYQKIVNILKGYLNRRTSIVRMIYALYYCRRASLKFMDQTVLNSILKKQTKLKYGLINESLGCWGPLETKRSHLLHHAVCTSGVADKLSLLDTTFDTYKSLAKV